MTLDKSTPEKPCEINGQSHEVFEHRKPDHGQVLVTMTLIVFMAVIGAFFSLTAEGVEMAVPEAESKGEVVKKTLPVPEWKPPASPKVEFKSPVDDVERSKRIKEKLGVELISLNLSAAGYMIDFRFRVLDVEKANIFFDSRIKPLLLVEKSNAKLPVPMAAKVGAFRATNRGRNIKPNKIYYIVFGNPDAHVKSGEKVTMILGDEQIKDLMVH